MQCQEPAVFPKEKLTQTAAKEVLEGKDRRRLAFFHAPLPSVLDKSPQQKLGCSPLSNITA